MYIYGRSSYHAAINKSQCLHAPRLIIRLLLASPEVGAYRVLHVRYVRHTLCSPMAAPIKLIYFPVRARAEAIRMCFAHGNGVHAKATLRWLTQLATPVPSNGALGPKSV